MTTPESRWTAVFLAVGVLALAVALWPRMAPPPPPKPALSQLESVLESGALRVVTVNSPVTYFNVQDREFGLEHDLAKRFAAHLGVELEMVVEPHFHRLFSALAEGRADLAAANITVTRDRRSEVDFGPVYQEVTQELVYRSGSRRPRDPSELVGRKIHVVAGSSYEETLKELQEELPELRWKALKDADIESIFAAISAGDVDFTVVDSTILAIHQRFFPQIRKAFSLSDPQSVAWAFPASDDVSLLREAEAFFGRIAESGRLDRIKDKYLAHIPSYNRVNTHYYLRHIKSRLPELEPYFKRAAEATGFDWKLLAAMAYQESHWDAAAVSRTGVRGIMMLTQVTARELGVDDRRDPAESIHAGARYLKRMKSRIPARIEEPDRTWMALAAYNVGWGHLEDARVITQSHGGDPDRWADVAEHLPLLSNKQYYVDTRYGYARGREPVRYVQNIRSYYDILNWQVGRRSMIAVAP